MKTTRDDRSQLLYV